MYFSELLIGAIFYPSWDSRPWVKNGEFSARLKNPGIFDFDRHIDPDELVTPTGEFE